MFTRETWCLGCLALFLLLVGCKDNHTLFNQPYSESSGAQKIWYSSFSEPAKTYDPGKAYSVSATRITGQIYEPPLQYHYLKRPYTLEPLLLTRMPTVRHYDQWQQLLPKNERQDRIRYTSYTLHLKPSVHYAPHPAFTQDQGQYRYHHLSHEQMSKIHGLSDFSDWQSRSVSAQDIAYALKRMADPKTNSPIYAMMSEHIVGLKELRESLLAAPAETAFELNKRPLSGVKVLDENTLEIWVRDQYPQFIYWLAMPFFAPVPWEAEVFYGQNGMLEKHLSLDWQPVGTGPYYLASYDPNRKIVLERNPLFHEEFYPHDERLDQNTVVASLQGKTLPLIDRLIFTKETEAIPRWAKFQQGYYDASTVIGDSFDQAIQLGPDGQFLLTPALRQKGIVLEETIEPSFFYTGFNWLDPVVGGEQHRQLRQAIAIALDYDEYIQIFLNGRGQRGLGPIPSGIEGSFSLQKGQINPIYQEKNGQWVRRPIAQAKQLLKEAGYPNGIDPRTGKPLRLNLDVALSGPTASAHLAWLRKQFQKIGLDLNIRNTDYNRFQTKMRQGKGQLFLWGWHADYPDPENFLFLFYGPNGKFRYQGENAGNYQSKAYDRLFLAMRDAKPGSSDRTMLVEKMQQQLLDDMPMIVNYYPIHLTLLHQWAQDIQPMPLTGNFMKYMDIEPSLRRSSIQSWNQASMGLVWCFFSMIALLVSSIFYVSYKRSRRVQVLRYQHKDQ